MNANQFWTIFMETGAPEAYLMYAKMRKMEASHVFDNAGPGGAGHGLQ